MERYKLEIVNNHGDRYVRCEPTPDGSWVMFKDVAALQARVAELENVLRAKVTEIERAYSHEGHCIECHGVVRAWGNTEHRDDCWYVKARAALGGKDE